MKKFLFSLLILTFVVVAYFWTIEEKLPVNDLVPNVKIEVAPLPPLVVEGSKLPQGIAGAFVMKTGDSILVGGGCNFPDKGPVEGGKKKFYATTWLLGTSGSAKVWTVLAEKLPVPVAYGVSTSSAWIGGENETEKLNSQWQRTLLGMVAIAPFPVKIDNAAGVDSFIAGGNIDGIPANKAFSSGDDPFFWRELPDFPGTPRIQPVCGLVDTPRGSAFVLLGGFYFDKENKRAVVDCAGVIYFPKEKKWERVPALPSGVSSAGLVGAVAVSDGRGGLLILGGVNAEIFKNALENPEQDYLNHVPAWYKFNADILRFSFDGDGNAHWEKLANVPATARAGASAVSVSPGEFFFICGELKPGVRSPDCIRIKVNFDKK